MNRDQLNPVKPAAVKAGSRARRKAGAKYRLIGVKLFYDTDYDLIKWCERAAAGDRSDELRTAIRNHIAQQKAAPQPATNHDVIRQADRVLSYAEEVTQRAASALVDQQAANARLTQQLTDLTRQIADLSAKLAAGGAMIDAGQPTSSQTADPDVPRLTPEQAAELKRKVRANKW